MKCHFCVRNHSPCHFGNFWAICWPKYHTFENFDFCNGSRPSRPWMIGPPVRIWSGPNKFGPYFFWSGPWSVKLVRFYLVRSVVRKFGPSLFGSVRSPEFLSGTSVRNSTVPSEVRYNSGPIWSEEVISVWSESFLTDCIWSEKF